MAKLIDKASKVGKPILQKSFVYEATFPKTPNFELILVSARLLKNTEAHDVLILDFKGQVQNADSFISSGDPVKFRYGGDEGDKYWTGYVHHIVPTSFSISSVTRIVCISASHIFKETDQKVYKDVTADQVVSQIASANGFAASTQRHPRVFPTISNTGQSQWQLMRRLAKQCGFALLVSNTTLKFMSKDQLFNDSIKKQLYFKFTDQEVPGGTAYASMYNFHPIVGDSVPDTEGAKVSRVVNGIHSVTGKVIHTTHSPSFNKGGRGVKGATQ